MQVSVEPSPVVLLLDAAPEVLLLDAAPVTILEAPTLDWSVPETPALVTPKAPEVVSDVVSIDFYFNIIEYAPPHSVFFGKKSRSCLSSPTMKPSLSGSMSTPS